MKTIFLAGDSTCAEKKSHVFPETGWGQMITDYLASDVTVSNRAVNGRSTKSFIAEGRFEPVFLTSIYRRHFHEGRLENLCHGDYPRAMKELGQEMKVSLIDKTELTEQWLTDMEELASREYFLILGPGKK